MIFLFNVIKHLIPKLYLYHFQQIGMVQENFKTLLSRAVGKPTLISHYYFIYRVALEEVYKFDFVLLAHL